MRKRILFGAAAAIVVLASCTDDALNITQEEAVAMKNVPVTFGTYMGKNATTRAGGTDAITTDKLKESDYGFGVFGYDTGADTYQNVVDASTSLRNAKRNFMYNERVTWDATNKAWTYSPIKYWPNAFTTGVVDDKGATAAAGDEHKLRFFAYAPYVNHAVSLGTTGITGLN